MIDVAEVEVRFEEIRLESDRALVERLCFGQLVASVMDVRQVDERGDEVGVMFQRLAIRDRGIFDVRVVAVVEHGAFAEVRLGQCRVADHRGRRVRQLARFLLRGTPERDDFGRRRVVTEIERELAVA